MKFLGSQIVGILENAEESHRFGSAADRGSELFSFQGAHDV